MADAIASARHRIATSYSDVVDLIESLSQKQNVIKNHNEQYLNQEVMSVFALSNDILHRISLETPILPRKIDLPYPQIITYRNQIDSLNVELDRQTRSYDTSIEISSQAYQRKINEISNEYQCRLSSLINDYSKEEEEILNKTMEIEKTFESRLQAETYVHIQERNDIYTKLVKLQNDYDTMHSNLSSSLSESEMRVEMLEQQRKMLIETNQNVTTAIEQKFQQQLEAMKSQCSIKIDSLEAENENLKNQIRNSIDLFNLEFNRLKDNLQGIEATMDKKLEGMMADQLLSYQKRKRKMESKHQKAVSEIRSKIETDEISSTNKIQLLQKQIELKKKFLEDVDKRYEENVSIITKKADFMINEKQNEMNLTTKIHKKTIKNIKQKHTLHLEKETHIAAKKRRALETKLQQTQKEGEVLQNKLKNEINALTRANEKFIADLKAKKEQDNNENQNESDKPNTNSNSFNSNFNTNEFQRLIKTKNRNVHKLNIYNLLIADVPPKSLTNNLQIDKEIYDRFNKFSDSGKIEISTISKALNNVCDQYKSEILLEKLKIDDVKRKRIFLEDDKKKIIEKIIESQDKFDLLKSRKFFLDNDEQNILNQKIVNQHSEIVQIKSEIQKIKEEGQKATKIPIEIIFEEQQNEIDQLKLKLNRLKGKKEQKENAIKSSYQNIIYEESKNTDLIVNNLSKLTDEALTQLKMINKQSKQELIKNHQTWMIIRKEMADSNNRLYNFLQNEKRNIESPSRIRNVQMRAQPLPILKK